MSAEPEGVGEGVAATVGWEQAEEGLDLDYVPDHNRTLRLPVLTNPLRPLLLAAAGSARLQRLVTGLPVSRAEDPLTCVVMGTGRCLEDKGLRHVLHAAY